MPHRPQRVCVVGPGTHFLSGMTYYTFSLANAMSGAFEVSAILMRRLLPAAFYPGRDRVGAALCKASAMGMSRSFTLPS